MRFLYGKVKAQVGHIVKVEFSEPTRVLIMTEREFEKYKNNLTFTYYGGQKDSPYEFTIPKSGTWYVVVEKGSLSKPRDIKASFSVTQPVAPVIDVREKPAPETPEDEEPAVEEKSEVEEEE